MQSSVGQIETFREGVIMFSLKLKGDASALNESRIKSPKQMANYSDNPKEAKYGLILCKGDKTLASVLMMKYFPSLTSRVRTSCHHSHATDLLLVSRIFLL